MNKVYCEACGVHWIVPELDSNLRHEIASLFREHEVITAIRRLREESSLSLRDAKEIALHITDEPGKCHRCTATLMASGMIICTNCAALNFDW